MGVAFQTDHEDYNSVLRDTSKMCIKYVTLAVN